MKTYQQPVCTLSEQGENRLLRAAMASEFLADVLSCSGPASSREVSAEGAAALFACIAEQLDGVIRESSLMKGERHDK